MKYQFYDESSYNLHLFKTDKFKTITIMVNFRTNIVKEEITLRSFISPLLMLSSKNYPSERLSCKKLESLYNPQIGYNDRRFGNQVINSFYINMINDKYLNEEGKTQECLNFFKEILFNPDVENNKFNIKSFNIVKNDITAKIRSIKDDSKYYSMIRMLENMNSNSPLSYRTGYLSDLDGIDESKVYEYYKNMLNSDIIDVFVLGDFDSFEMKKQIKEMIPINTIKKDKKDIYIKHTNFSKRAKKIIEEEKVSQSKLVIGCKINDLNEFERKYVLPIYSDILGGPSYSKLFQNVREKNSLSYYIYSNYSRGDNILTISSGINKENFDKALKLIKTEIANMAKGNIFDNELKRAQEDMVSIIKQIEDKPFRLINNYVSQVLFGLDDIEKRKNQIFKVTKNDVKSISKKIQLDTIYLLSGGDSNEGA
jgi:predicted Zn-dependent peptidase